MATFPIQVCPNPECGARHVAVTTIQAIYSIQDHLACHVMAQCEACKEPVLIKATVSKESDRHLFGNLGNNAQGNPFKADSRLRIESIVPVPPRSDTPDHLDPRVATAFEDAEANIRDMRPNPAVMSLRRALDIGLRIAEQSLTGSQSKLTLHKRIDALAADGHLTKALQDWSHHVRLEGNDANHDVDDYDIDEARALLEFTRYLFIYVFTLPEQVRRASASSTAASPATP